MFPTLFDKVLLQGKFSKRLSECLSNAGNWNERDLNASLEGKHYFLENVISIFQTCYLNAVSKHTMHFFFSSWGNIGNGNVFYGQIVGILKLL